MMKVFAVHNNIFICSIKWWLSTFGCKDSEFQYSNVGRKKVSMGGEKKKTMINLGGYYISEVAIGIIFSFYWLRRTVSSSLTSGTFKLLNC